jgi:hypothetical protein
LGAIALYQGVVIIPGLRQNLGEARVLPAFQLIAESRGEESRIVVPFGTPSFAVSVDVPPDAHFPEYLCNFSVAGHAVFSLKAPAPPVGQPITILVPTGDLRDGVYELAIYGAKAGGHQRDRISTFSFALKFH